MDENKLAKFDNKIDNLVFDLEKYKQTENGVEFWFARDLQKILGYASWDKFIAVLDKAKTACENSGMPIDSHFSHAGKMTKIGGSEATRELQDYKLTRYACYLIAQNGDSRKQEISYAQTYFALQTRRQELAEKLSEDELRINIRNEIKKHNKILSGVVKEAGVITGLDYAIFTNEGYKGLYNGLDRKGIQAIKGLNDKQDILNHMSSEELAANLFKTTQTSSKIKRDGIKSKAEANNAHYNIGKTVREAIENIGGTMPERLPSVEDIKKVEKRLKKENKIKESISHINDDE